ncbi:MAG TPA: hypothetical protein VHN11_07855, partial [Xanthobacteraceae bacterium]|nr:hypothetical protein [Xanthobacteraceae bacterium]
MSEMKIRPLSTEYSMGTALVVIANMENPYASVAISFPQRMNRDVAVARVHAAFDALEAYDR